MNVDDLKRWAERCERDGRYAQAILVRNIAWEVEHGAKWLEIMAQHNIEIPVDEQTTLADALKTECDHLSEEILVQLALSDPRQPS